LDASGLAKTAILALDYGAATIPKVIYASEVRAEVIWGVRDRRARKAEIVAPRVRRHRGLAGWRGRGWGRRWSWVRSRLGGGGRSWCRSSWRGRRRRRCLEGYGRCRRWICRARGCFSIPFGAPDNAAATPSPMHATTATAGPLNHQDMPEKRLHLSRMMSYPEESEIYITAVVIRIVDPRLTRRYAWAASYNSP
jgi:hypothetical protein